MLEEAVKDSCGCQLCVLLDILELPAPQWYIHKFIEELKAMLEVELRPISEAAQFKISMLPRVRSLRARVERIANHTVIQQSPRVVLKHSFRSFAGTEICIGVGDDQLSTLSLPDLNEEYFHEPEAEPSTASPI